MVKTRAWIATILAFGLLVAACGAAEPEADDAPDDAATDDTADDGAEPAEDGETAEGESVQLQFASYNVPRAAEAVASAEWAERIEEATGGRVQVEFFYQEALLGAAETLQGVSEGRADMGYIATAYYPGELPLSNVVGLPFVTEDPEAQARAFIDLYESYEPLREEWQAQGVHIVTWAPVPPNIIISKDPIGGLEDLQGMQVRGYGYVSEAVAAVGANPVGISQPEVYEALQRGVLDATSGASLDIAVDRDFQEVASHFVDAGFGNYAITANIVNLDTWESLPEDLREVIEQESEDYLDLYMEELVRLEDESCDTVLSSGGEITILPPEESEEWRELAADDLRAQWESDVTSANPDVDPAEFYERYEEALREHEEASEYTPAMQRCAERQ